MYEEVCQFREACGEAHMKSILAIGELGTYTNVYKASLVAMMAGECYLSHTHVHTGLVFYTLGIQLTFLSR